jgi:predicted methyltransferase
MFVTTSAKGERLLKNQAIQTAEALDIPFYKRGRQSIEGMFKVYQAQDCILVASEGLKWLKASQLDEPFFFHPGSAMFRVKRLLNGEEDPLIACAQLRSGDRFLDCTLGLASDAIVAAVSVGQEGRVTGIEAVPLLAYMVSEGLRKWDTSIDGMNQAMRAIDVIQDQHLSCLQSLDSNSYDVVYFDPMFEESIQTSSGISALKQLAYYEPLMPEAIIEAKRVAKRRVVLKDASYSKRFKSLGFTALERKYASFWYGYIEAGKNN